MPTCVFQDVHYALLFLPRPQALSCRVLKEEKLLQDHELCEPLILHWSCCYNTDKRRRNVFLHFWHTIFHQYG